MSLHGVGTDIVAVSRISALVARHEGRFLARCFRSGECVDARRGGRLSAAALAGRWAVKEAFMKALGGDVRGVPYRDIEVRRLEGGGPGIVLHGIAAAALAARGGGRVLVSLSHEREYAVAVVIIED